MIPNINLFGKIITPYMVMALIGTFITSMFACHLTKKKNKDINDTIVLLLFSALGILIGGHLLYGITNLGNIFGGSVFYGGLIGGLIFGVIYIKKQKLDKIIYYDIGAVIIPLFHSIARIGCFLSGCCYGIESKYGFTYRYSLIESANNVNRFPIQLVESGYNLILFIILYRLYKNGMLKGKLIYLYLIFYSFARFIIEFFRGDEYRGFLLGFSTSQIISIILFVFSIIMLIIKKKISNQ